VFAISCDGAGRAVCWASDTGLTENYVAQTKAIR